MIVLSTCLQSACSRNSSCLNLNSMSFCWLVTIFLSFFLIYLFVIRRLPLFKRPLKSQFEIRKRKFGRPGPTNAVRRIQVSVLRELTLCQFCFCRKSRVSKSTTCLVSWRCLTTRDRDMADCWSTSVRITAMFHVMWALSLMAKSHLVFTHRCLFSRQLAQ